MSQYHLDLSKLPLDWLREKIESHEIVPARNMLQERLDERFALLQQAEIETVGDLVSVLKTRDHIALFADRSGLPQDYLVWLGREARSYRPNPFGLRDIPGVDSEVIERLDRAGIKTTKALFDRAAVKTERRRLAEEIEVAEDALDELVRLSDLARIRGMGRTFARLFAESGADCAAALARCEPGELHTP